MSVQLERFTIEGLHNTHTIDVKLKDNKLVLVGENGSGKSTVANFIYFFLTQQWERMVGYEFKHILAILGGEKFEMSQNELLTVIQLSNISQAIVNRFKDDIIRLLVQYTNTEIFLSEIATDIMKKLPLLEGDIIKITKEKNIPTSKLKRTMQLKLEDFINNETAKDNKNLHFEKLKRIRTVSQPIAPNQILYLPTYRRIEQDLKSILKNVDINVPTTSLTDKKEQEKNYYLELVEFGMEDVKAIISDKMKILEDKNRNDLTTLNGTYLRDVIQGKFQLTSIATELKDIDDDTINAIFSRIPKHIIGNQEQNRLKDIITQIRNAQEISLEHKIAAHFLSQLVDLYKAQQKEERDIQAFVNVCNNYLINKQIVYDNVNFKVFIEQQVKGGPIKKISMDMLSSGEKQIISLFSHLYLSNGADYFVIIDEPELSLSLPWQRRFLPDILNTGRCNGLIATTHSPFIIENELDAYAHSLEEFTKPIGEPVNALP